MDKKRYWGRMLMQRKNLSLHREGAESQPDHTWNFQGPSGTWYDHRGLSVYPPACQSYTYSAVAACFSPQHSFNRNYALVEASPSIICPCFECGMPSHYRKYYVLKLMGKVHSVVSKRMYTVELVLCLQNEVLCWAPTAIPYGG